MRDKYRRTRTPVQASPLNAIALALLLTLVLMTGGCAHTASSGEFNGEPTKTDPWEPFNRSMFRFNKAVDDALVKPIAKGYKKVVPSFARKGVGNVFRNLGEPTTIVNDLLQAKPGQAGQDLLRFLVNSTVGLLGWFDAATPIGLVRHNEDFGQTFSVWGIARGPYLVLPLIGPSTVTDGIGLIPATLYTDPRTATGETTTTYALLGVNLIDTRARLLGASKLLELQLDPYLFVRETYLQRRRLLIHDGNLAPEKSGEWPESPWD